MSDYKTEVDRTERLKVTYSDYVNRIAKKIGSNAKFKDTTTLLEKELDIIFKKMENNLGFSGTKNLKNMNRFLENKNLVELYPPFQPVYLPAVAVDKDVKPLKNHDFLYDGGILYCFYNTGYKEREVYKVTLDYTKFPINIAKWEKDDKFILKGYIREIVCYYRGCLYYWEGPKLHKYDVRTKTVSDVNAVKLDDPYADHICGVLGNKILWYNEGDNSLKTGHAIYDIKTDTTFKMKEYMVRILPESITDSTVIFEYRSSWTIYNFITNTKKTFNSSTPKPFIEVDGRKLGEQSVNGSLKWVDAATGEIIRDKDSSRASYTCGGNWYTREEGGLVGNSYYGEKDVKINCNPISDAFTTFPIGDKCFIYQGIFFKGE